MKPSIQKGFTLVEVLISMFIMATLTVLVSTSIRTAVQNKKKLEAKIQSERLIYDTLRLLKLDIEKAFHYQDVFYEIESLALKQLDNEKNKNKQNPSAQGGDNPPRTPPIKLTHFLGGHNNLHFTNLNHFRTQYNAQESDQMEVGYYLESCADQDGKGSSQCLWRRSSAMIDDRVDEGGAKTVILRNVDDFKLEYRSNKEVDDWVKEWRSDNKGRVQHRNRFPHFVKIHLKLKDKNPKKKKAIKRSIVIPIAFPNNETIKPQDKSQKNNNSGGTNP